MTHLGPSDEELVRHYRAGDHTALAKLINRYTKTLHGLVLAIVRQPDTAHDVVQETFVKVWRNLEKFDVRKKFKNWIFTIARRTAIDTVKSFDVARFTPLSRFENRDDEFSILETIPDPKPRADELLEQRELHHFLHRLIEGVQPQFRDVLELHYRRGHHFQEIADTLDIPLNTALTRHYRGLLAMKKLAS